MKRARVLFHAPLPPPHNGMTILGQQILGSSLAREFELVHVDTSDHRGVSNIGSLDLLNVLLAIKHGARFAWKLVTRWPDLVYVQIAGNRLGVLRDLQFLLTARLFRRTVVVHFQSRGFEEFFLAEPAWMRWLIRAGLPERTHLVVLGNAVRSDFGSLIAPGHVHVMQNGAFDLGPGPNAGSREPLVVLMATLMTEKGVFDLLHAIPTVVARVARTRFAFAGTWFRDDERRAAERFVAEHGLEARVDFPGALEGERKVEIMRAASVVVLPSKYKTECQPLVILDAISAATPVIVTRIGTTSEMFDNGAEGFLIDQGDVDALADRLSELLSDSELRTRMGLAARRRYERDYQLEMFAQRVARVWNSVLAGTSGGPGSTWDNRPMAPTAAAQPEHRGSTPAH